MTEDPRFRVGVVGAGHISEFHLRALGRIPRVQVVGVADQDVARARAIADRFRAPVACVSLGELGAHGLDVVHVLTPPDSHAELTLQALALGCHVMVEKPLATSVADCDAIVAAARAAGKDVCVGHSLLRDPFVARALDLVRGGAIGEVVTVDYLRSQDYPPYLGGPRPPQYRDGGFPFRDIGVHALYLMDAFLGEIRDVTAAFASRGGDPNLHVDEWRVLVRCDRGIGQVQLSWNVRPLQNMLIVQGTRGLIRVDLFGMSVAVKRTTRLPGHAERAFNAVDEARQVLAQVPANLLRVVGKKIRRYHGLQDLVADFYAALAAGRPAPVPAERARPIVEWTERVADEADAAKERFLERFPRDLSAKILVTGGSGFIGGHLLRRLLDEGHRVRILVRRMPRPEVLNDSRVEVVLGDLGDPEAVDRAVAGVEVVYHVGGVVHGDAHEFRRGTVVGTANVVESVLRHRVPRLVHISSLSVLHAAAAGAGATITEDWPLEPHADRRGHYTQTKLEAERIVTRAAAERGLSAVILRPGQVFGPGSPLLTGAVARRVKGRLVVLGDGTMVLPLVYVEDVVDAILLAARGDVFDGSIFHIVDGPALTQNELARVCLRDDASGAAIVRVPRPIVYGMALGVQTLAKALRRSAPLSIYRVRSALAGGVFDCAAAERRLGWTPRVGVLGGIEATLTAAKS